MAVVIEQFAGTKDPIVPHASGDFYEVVGQLKFSGNYPANGEIKITEEIEAILKEVGQGLVFWLDVQGDTAGFLFAYNYSTKKLQIYQTGTALKGAFEELPAVGYPAAITGAVVRIFAMGK